jgi:hypothetical protein
MYKQYFHVGNSKSSEIIEQEYITPGISVVRSGAKIIVELPFPSTVCLFYRKMLDGVIISTDLREMYIKGDTLDSAGIASLLLLGFPVPPLTPYKEIHAFIPGFRHTINLQTFAISLEVSCNWSIPNENDVDLKIDSQAKIVAQHLDKTLENLCPTKDPIVLFSGGVDSSLLASRLVSMGWNQTSFIHYSFGEYDKDTLYARKIANDLGVKLDIIQWDLELGLESITKATTLYHILFCDHFCIQTHCLSCEIKSRYEGNRVVLDGSGADTDFGLYGRTDQIRKLYSIPTSIRKIMSSPYGLLKLWKKRSKLEHFCDVIRRSTTLAELPFSIAQNPLLGIGFYTDPNDVQLVESLCDNWISSIAQSNDKKGLFALMDIAACSLSNAQKIREPLLIYSFFPNYPYLDHQIVDLAVKHARFWPGSTEGKKIIKYMLANAVSKEYVYRKKIVFPPLPEMFSHPITLDHLEAVTDANSILAEVVNIKLVKSILKEVEMNRRRLPGSLYNFLWAITFCNTWLSQMENGYNEISKSALVKAALDY